MKKFDIQRFAKRRIQVGDNLQGKIIYTDIFTKEEVEEFANECGDWQNYYIVSSTAGQYKSGIHEQMVPNEAENKISSYKIDIAGQTIIQYDGTDITTQNNEISLVDYENSILIDSIQRYNFNHEIVEDDGGKRYRKFYIEDAHVRPLVSGDEITTNTKFYFNIPDNIYSSLSGVTNPITLNGSDGFKINCIGNGSDQTLIRFSNAMGSTEEANIYDMVNGTLNTNKSMMQNVTTMDSNWVGTVRTADSTHPLYNMILVDETTLGNYVEPVDPSTFPANIRKIIGDNLKGKTLYINIPDDFYLNSYSGSGYVMQSKSDDFYIRIATSLDNSEFTIYLVCGNELRKVLYRVVNNQLITSGKQIITISETALTADSDYEVTMYSGGALAGDYIFIEDPNVRPLQIGDYITENTLLYFNFPNELYQQEIEPGYIYSSNENTFAISFGRTETSKDITFDSENYKEIYFYDEEQGTKDISNRPIVRIYDSYGTVSFITDNEYINSRVLVDVTTLGEAPIPTTSMGSISYKNGGSWNKLLSLAQEQVPLKGSIMSGPIKWSAVNSTTECTDSKTLYFVFGEEETGPTYETLTVQARGATYGDSISGGSGSHILVVKNSDSEQNEYPYTVSLNGSGFYTDLEFSVVTNKPFQLGITFSYGLDTSMSSNQVSLGATLLDLNSYESFSFNTVVTGTEGVGQTYWFPTTNTNGTELTFDWLKNASLRITSSVSEYGQACLSGDTKIKTSNNDIYISDLELGDKVIDRDNQETEITKVYNHKIDTVYQIHLDNDETIECSYDHKFLVNDEKAVTAAQLKENDKLGQHTITSIDIINKELDVYEIKTESNTYTLANGIICECENI